MCRCEGEMTEGRAEVTAELPVKEAGESQRLGLEALCESDDLRVT